MEEGDGHVEATITERSFSGSGYDFCVRLAVLSSEPVYRRFIDGQISAAWLEAAADLGIRVIAPFSLATNAGDSLLYEAYVPDFGGSKGMVVGSLDRDDGDMRKLGGYGSSDLSDVYRRYDRKLFIDTLDDWRWTGEECGPPSWYTGKTWA